MEGWGAKTLSPQEVRSILNTDNKEIVELCKKASILPRKNSKGQTYFSYDEVKHLRAIQSKKNALMTAPVTNGQAWGGLSIINTLNNIEDNLS